MKPTGRSSTERNQRMRRRRHGRELALKALFSYEAGGGDPFQELRYLSHEEAAEDEAGSFAGELIEGVLAHWSDLDQEIRRLARSWDLQRIAFVDRNLLRVAIFEIRWRTDIPVSVSISEAVELAKMYGGSDSGRFVNGILGQFVRESEMTSETTTNVDVEGNEDQEHLDVSKVPSHPSQSGDREDSR